MSDYMLHDVPGVPDDILSILYDWQKADDWQLSRVKQHFCGRCDVLFDLNFYGDVDKGTAYIKCTVLEKTGDGGNLDILGEIYIERTGWRFVNAKDMYGEN